MNDTLPTTKTRFMTYNFIATVYVLISNDARHTVAAYTKMLNDIYYKNKRMGITITELEVDRAIRIILGKPIVDPIGEIFECGRLGIKVTPGEYPELSVTDILDYQRAGFRFQSKINKYHEKFKFLQTLITKIERNIHYGEMPIIASYGDKNNKRTHNEIIRTARQIILEGNYLRAHLPCVTTNQFGNQLVKYRLVKRQTRCTSKGVKGRLFIELNNGIIGVCKPKQLIYGGPSA